MCRHMSYLLRNVISQHYYYEVTIKTFHVVNANLTVSNKGESGKQNAAYKLIALEL